jgi:hypothetical protein
MEVFSVLDCFMTGHEQIILCRSCAIVETIPTLPEASKQLNPCAVRGLLGS